MVSIILNKEYQQSKLFNVDPDPFIQFQQWFEEACQAMATHLANAMVLATISETEQPSARVVLLKEFNHDGFIFYTNYRSQKGREITHNPRVALLFWWEQLERQVRIEGLTEKIPSAQSDRYFSTRPKGSQIAALASQQSQSLASVDDLQQRYEELSGRYAAEGAVVPRPSHWGGYLVKPERFEYWQGRENRLHDRFQYTHNAQGKWDITRLYP